MKGGRMKKKQEVVAIVAIFLAVLVLFSGCRQDPQAHKADKLINYLADELELTPAQKEMLEEFKEEMLERRDTMRSARRLQMEEVMTEIKKDAINKDRLMEMYNETKPKIDNMAMFIISSLVDFHSTLTPEQRTKLIDKLEKLKKWHSYMQD